MSRRTGAVALALGLAAACARMGPPPGGPSDKAAPRLVQTVPESAGSYPGWNSDVEFRFDEVVSEGGSPNLGTGTGDLEKLLILSPSEQVPVVHWKRDRITLRPREGWQPGRVYRVELLPGIIDLRRNRSDTSLVVTFATGGPAPTDTIRGTVIDWAAGKPGRGALVELRLEPDSLTYRTVADSTGRFEIGPLPRAAWTVYAANDQNRNHRREPREAWDSTVLPAGATATAPLWIIPRDTVGPRITTVTADDSVRATISFSLPLDPTQPVERLALRLLRQADSSPVAIASLLPKPVADSLARAAQAARDASPADTTAADTTAPPVKRPPPRQAGAPRAAVDSLALAREAARIDSLLRTRPVLYDKLVLQVAEPFEPEGRYLVEIAGVRSVAGAAADAKGVLAIPKPRAAPGRDTLPPPPDSVGAVRDTAPPPPTPKP